MKTYTEVFEMLKNKKDRSAWNRGVNEYALELLETLDESIERSLIAFDKSYNTALIRKILLDGASDWKQYSWGGSSLIYDGDIAERLCTPSELKKTRNGERRPNSREEWLDTQARALSQACNRICRAFNA